MEKEVWSASLYTGMDHELNRRKREREGETLTVDREDVPVSTAYKTL